VDQWRQAVVVTVLITTGAYCLRAAESGPRRVIRFTIGLGGGSPANRAIGDALVRGYVRSDPDIELQLLDSPNGSLETIDALQSGETDFGIAAADVSYLAFAGKLENHPGRFDQLRGIAVLDLARVHLIVRAGSNISSVRELRGRTVSVGPDGSETRFISEVVLQAFGVDRSALRIAALAFGASFEQLASGKIDALFATLGDPAPMVAAAAESGARLLPLEGAPIDALRRRFRFLQLTQISRGTYARHDMPVRTIGVEKTLLCRRDLSDDDVYRFTSQLFAVLPSLASSLSRIRFSALEHAPATPVPLHPGAARYYRERELAQ
jgi:TRAP transporter TAXI family solute receptor